MSPRLCNSGIEKFFVEAFALNTHYAFSGSNCNSGTWGSCVRQEGPAHSVQLIGIHQGQREHARRQGGSITALRKCWRAARRYNRFKRMKSLANGFPYVRTNLLMKTAVAL